MKKLLIICILIIGIVFISGCTSEEKTNSESQSNGPLINPTTLLKGYESVEYKTTAIPKEDSFIDPSWGPSMGNGDKTYEGDIPIGKKRVSTNFVLINDARSTWGVSIYELDSDSKLKEYFSQMENSLLESGKISKVDMKRDVIGDYSIQIPGYPLMFSFKNYFVTVGLMGCMDEQYSYTDEETLEIAKAIMNALQ